MIGKAQKQLSEVTVSAWNIIREASSRIKLEDTAFEAD